MTPEDREWIASEAGAGIARLERVQALWGGYGEIVRVHLADGRTLIAKWVNAPDQPGDIGHQRKVRSYDVERNWYRDYETESTCRIAKHLGSRTHLLLLEDLNAAGFAGRRHHLDDHQISTCLAWLASFHARFLGQSPDGLWPVGTYWHLETRPDELAVVDDDLLRLAAPELDRRLREARFQTIVHGDAKPANFCFGPRGVAAVDFQYVGGGCGMKDVAYLISDDPRASFHLDTYFRHFARPDVEAEWRKLYPIACADYYRFIAGWAPEHWKRDAAAQAYVRDVVRGL